MAGICKICLTPYRSEIEKAWKLGVKRVQIFRKYKPLIGYEGTESAFSSLMCRHWKHKNKAGAILLPTPEGAAQPITPATIENFGKKFLELGMLKLETAGPGDVKFQEVISAQKLVLDSRKLKLSEDALTLMLGRLFGPKIEKVKREFIEGEVVEDECLPAGRGKDSGDQPKNL